MKNNRNGARAPRGQKRRTPDLGYYLIVTDTQETEKNYLDGLKREIPDHLQNRLVINVKRTETSNLIEEVSNLISISPQYREPWIVFDKDQNLNFDEIIRRAEARGIRVGWSNPCIEIWFLAYFSTMPTYQNSKSCVDGFSDLYIKKTRSHYQKSDRDIYEKLNKYGDQKKAIRHAKQKKKEYEYDKGCLPSNMNPGTTLHELVEEILAKVNSSNNNRI